MTSITSEMRNITVVTGRSFPSRAAWIEPPAVCIQSLAVAFLSSVPMAKMVAMTTKIISIMGMKLGAR